MGLAESRRAAHLKFAQAAGGAQADGSKVQLLAGQLAQAPLHYVMIQQTSARLALVPSGDCSVGDDAAAARRGTFSHKLFFPASLPSKD